jgi:hypothetical protein
VLQSGAFDRYFRQDRRLQGLYSLFYIDDVAIVSLPDAVHRGWREPGEYALANSLQPPALPTPDSSVFVGCEQEHEVGSPFSGEIADATGDLQRSNEILPVVISDESYSPQSLLDVQHALTHFCLARRDVLGIVTLPRHYDKRECVSWDQSFRRRLGVPQQRVSGEDFRESVDLSYLAVYHPWSLVSGGEPGNLTAVPVDGHVCGMIAARERARQVWVAPANVPLQGVLGLDPELSPSDQEEQFTLQFNLLRREPRDIRVMSAQTFSDRAELLQISARRLMILLRKVITTLGAEFVFEANDQRVRQRLQVALERMLLVMFQRGALAGAAPNQSFQIVSDVSVNTRQSVELGRFIAEIRVAPSQPAEFLTVVLTRAGDSDGGQLQVEEL